MAIVPFTDPLARGYVGQQVNAEEWNAVTRLATDTATTPIGMGQPVQRVAGESLRVEAWDGTSPIMGVTVYHVGCDSVTGFPEDFNTPVMTAGVLYAAAGAAATAGNPAGYDPATDRWANVAGDYVNVPGVEFDTNATSGNIVRLRIQRPAAAVPAETGGGGGE